MKGTKLRTSNKRVRSGLVALAAVIGSLMAVGAAPAMASPHWSSTSEGIRVSGTVTASTDSLSYGSETCTTPSVSAQRSSMWSTFAIIEGGGTYLNLTCSESTRPLQIVFLLNGLQTTSVRVENLESVLQSPWEAHYHGSASTADWVNGSGSSPSTMTFSNDQIGYIPSGGGFNPSVYLNGTLNVTTASGGLLTIQP